jgi:hypothetical protein
MVRQEIYGYLLTHYAISALISKAATETGIDPDRVKFKRTVRIAGLPSTTCQGASLARGASGSPVATWPRALYHARDPQRTRKPDTSQRTATGPLLHAAARCPGPKARHDQ